jgi:hypothetical protein
LTGFEHFRTALSAIYGAMLRLDRGASVAGQTGRMLMAANLASRIVSPHRNSSAHGSFDPLFDQVANRARSREHSGGVGMPTTYDAGLLIRAFGRRGLQIPHVGRVRAQPRRKIKPRLVVRGSLKSVAAFKAFNFVFLPGELWRRLPWLEPAIELTDLMPSCAPLSSFPCRVSLPASANTYVVCDVEPTHLV